jgi:uncharacterized protein (DUF2062 family)
MNRKYFTEVSRQYQQKEHPWYMLPLSYLMTHPVYFSVNRKTISRAIWIGVFIGFLPIPMQMLVAVMLALVARVNIPIAAIGVWVTNPFTMVPLFYLAYRLGAAMLNMPIEPWPIDFNFSGFSQDMGGIWKAMLYGGVVLGLSLATVSYIFVNLVWRTSIAYRYRERKKNRRISILQLNRKKADTETSKKDLST